MNAVNDLRADIHRSVETESNVSTKYVVVDCFRQTDNIQPLLGEHIGGLVGSVTAEREQAVQLKLLVGLLHFLNLVHFIVFDYLHHLERGALCAEDSAARRQYPRKIRGLHFLVSSMD